MTLTRQSILIAFLALASPIASAQIVQPTCTAPVKPEKLETQDEISLFGRKVEEFQSCLMTFVEEQQRISKEHNDAANVALKTWNDFADLLNNKK